MEERANSAAVTNTDNFFIKTKDFLEKKVCMACLKHRIQESLNLWLTYKFFFHAVYFIYSNLGISFLFPVF